MSRRVLTAGLVLALATAAGLYFATQMQLAYPEPFRSSWGHALEINLVFYWVWAAAVPLCAWLLRRFPLDRKHWRLSLPAHLVLGAGVTVAQIVVGKVLMMGSTTVSLVTTLQMNFHASYPTYWIIVLALVAWRAASLEARLAETRLDALRAQLQPHFLFNALNSVSSLMYSDVAAADAMVTRLSDLLRLTLKGDPRRLIPLREELELLGRYLAIERVRFEERLRVRIDVAQGVEDALVPPLALQPIVENAVRHAVAPRSEGGAIEVVARREGRDLVIEISDDGPGLADGAPAGVGLANTRARLAELGGSLELGAAIGGGLAVTLRLPA